MALVRRQKVPPLNHQNSTTMLRKLIGERATPRPAANDDDVLAATFSQGHITLFHQHPSVQPLFTTHNARSQSFDPRGSAVDRGEYCEGGDPIASDGIPRFAKSHRPSSKTHYNLT